MPASTLIFDLRGLQKTAAQQSARYNKASAQGDRRRVRRASTCRKPFAAAPVILCFVQGRQVSPDIGTRLRLWQLHLALMVRHVAHHSTMASCGPHRLWHCD